MNVNQSPDHTIKCELDVVVRSALNKKIHHGTLKFSYVNISGIKDVLLQTLFINVDMKGLDPHLYITVNEFRDIVGNLDPKFSQKVLDKLQIDRIWIRQGKTI
jgi:hypothetical protein